MPRRSILSTTEQMSLLALPESQNDLIRYYTFNETDVSLIRQRRGDANKLGFAVQLCLLRYPGSMLGSDLIVSESLIQWVASQIRVDAAAWIKYAERDETRREHFQELRSYLGLSPFSLADFRLLIKGLSDLAMQTDKGLVIAIQATELLRQRQIILPALNVIDRACAEAITLATRRIYRTLIEPLTAEHKQRLDDLLKVKPETGITWLVWLRQSPVKPNSRHMLEQIDRLKTFQKLALPVGIGRDIHQNRLLKMAREGGRMTPQDLAKFETKRRYATLVALALEGTATVTDQLIDLHDRILVKMFSTAKHKHHQQFQDKGKAINDKVRLYSKVGHALLDAKESDSDPFEAIEAVISWEDFMLSITEADQLSQPESFDHLHLVTESFNMLRRYTPEFLNVLKLNAAPAAQRVLDAITVIRGMNARGSRQLEQQLATVRELALANELPNAIITDTGLKITQLETVVPDGAQRLIDQTSALLPRIKITELLMEVDDWTGFTRHFVHLKDGQTAPDRTLLLSAILADAINLGLTKMAESSPGLTYDKLSWLQAWHIRDETYSAGLADLVNAQFHHNFANNWGDGTTSSSDGQRFRASSKAQSTGHVNPKYGSDPGRTFYTHISDQYAPFSSRVVNVGIRDSTYVLDGLLYHESDLRIEEHYTDTAGFTDHVFALMHLLGFRFAPRIRDLKDTKLYVPKNEQDYSALQAMNGGTLNLKHIRDHWDEILRLAASIKQGTVTASLMMRKLGAGRVTRHASYPRQNGLSIALRELGRIERTLFILDWLQNVELRRRVHAGLNKGEARNALARAVFFNRLGEIRDRSFDQQSYRASGLNLVTAAIVLWNTVYIERAIEAQREVGKSIDDELLQYLSPLGWEHINLTGDYVLRQNKATEAGQFRSLRLSKMLK